MEGRDLMPVCEACNGVGWILANTGECHEDIQRCDACEVYVKHPDGSMGWNMLTWLPANRGGLMSMPCDKCGYKFGTQWLHEDVPTDVLAWLRGLPDTDTTPAWV